MLAGADIPWQLLDTDLPASTAAGAVGSCVGQIVKIQGCRAVGITGSTEKARICLEAFGFDGVIDYRADELDPALTLCVNIINPCSSELRSVVLLPEQWRELVFDEH